MTFLNTQPAAIGPPPVSPAWSQFGVTDPYRCRAMLREACSGNAPVTINTVQGHTLMGSLWSIDDARGTLHFKIESEVPDWPELTDLPSEHSMWAVLYLKEVKVQFRLYGASLQRGAQGNSLRAEMPEVLYRLARRRTNRVKRAKGQVGHASGQLPACAGSGTFRWALDDLSTDGCGLWVPAAIRDLPIDTMLNNVCVELAGETAFQADLQVRFSTDRTPGAADRHVGCAWFNLLESAHELLKRWQRGGQLQRDLVKISLNF